MKKIDIIFSVVLVPLDYLLLIAAGTIAYWARYQNFVTQVRPVFFDVQFDVYFNLLTWAALLGVIVFAWSGLYNMKTALRLGSEFKKVFLAVSTTLLIIIITIFLKRELFSSRFIILLAWILSVLVIFLGRVLLYRIKAALFKRGIGSYHLVIIGSGQASEIISEYYTKRQNLGRLIIARFDNFLGFENDIVKLHQERGIDEIIQTDTDDERKNIQPLIDFCNDSHIDFRYLAGLYQSQLINFYIDNIASYPIISVKRTPLDGWGRVVKRFFDEIFSVLFLLILSPVFLIIAICIKFDSKGPIILRLKRVGQHGQDFYVLKFRSMIDGADKMKDEILKYNERNDGPLFKMKNDPRITKVGKFLRRSSLDELPQLINVIKGQMSLVGPRPHEPREVSQYNREYKKLLTIKPGLTGAAQVSGRSQLKFNEEASLDIYYIENWSLALDLIIIIKTPLAVLNYKAVY